MHERPGIRLCFIALRWLNIGREAICARSGCSEFLQKITLAPEYQFEIKLVDALAASVRWAGLSRRVRGSRNQRPDWRSRDRFAAHKDILCRIGLDRLCASSFRPKPARHMACVGGEVSNPAIHNNARKIALRRRAIAHAPRRGTDIEFRL
jgi:hypothetical protein